MWYFVVMVATPHRQVRTQWFRRRGKVHDHYLYFIVWLGKNGQHEVKREHADNESEFLELQKTLIQSWIVLTALTPYTAKLNGSVKRANWTLITRIGSMMKVARMSRRYWGETLLLDSYLYSRTVMPVIAMNALHELLFGTSPSNSNIRTYSSAACAHRYKSDRSDKIDDRADTNICTE